MARQTEIELFGAGFLVVFLKGFTPKNWWVFVGITQVSELWLSVSRNKK